MEAVAGAEPPSPPLELSLVSSKGPSLGCSHTSVWVLMCPRLVHVAQVVSRFPVEAPF